MKDEERNMDKVLLSNNDMFMEKYRLQQMDHHKKELDFWNQELKLSQSLKNLKSGKQWAKFD